MSLSKADELRMNFNVDHGADSTFSVEEEVEGVGITQTALLAVPSRKFDIVWLDEPFAQSDKLVC